MLERDAIEVWTVGLDVDVNAAEKWYRTLLSDEERTKADAYATEKLRRDSIVAHAALRVVLGRVLGISACAVELEKPGGKELGGGTRKPSLALAGDGQYTGVGMVDRARVEKNGNEVEFPDTRAGESGYGKTSPVRFNLSHSGGIALIGVARGFEVGVDIERHRPDTELTGPAEIVMSDGELRAWLELSEEDRYRGFFRLWTRKEAYIKATGRGLFADLNKITVPVNPERMPGPSTVEDEIGQGSWTTADLDAPEGYSAAVCWEGDGDRQVVMPELSHEEVSHEGMAQVAGNRFEIRGRL
jgi:4'-phosphopantetheinyl transferase